MAKIIEKTIEPSKIKVGSIFRLKIKLEDKYTNKSQLISEEKEILITETGKKLVTEWGE